VRVLCVINPGNPTGQCLTEDTIKEVNYCIIYTDIYAVLNLFFYFFKIDKFLLNIFIFINIYIYNRLFKYVMKKELLYWLMKSIKQIFMMIQDHSCHLRKF